MIDIEALKARRLRSLSRAKKAVEKIEKEIDFGGGRATEEDHAAYCTAVEVLGIKMNLAYKVATDAEVYDAVPELFL